VFNDRALPVTRRPRDYNILDFENTHPPYSFPSFKAAPDGSHQALARRGRCSVPAFMQVVGLEHGGPRLKSRMGVQLCVADAQSRAQLSSFHTPTALLSSTWPTMVGHSSVSWVGGQGDCSSFAHESPADTTGGQCWHPPGNKEVPTAYPPICSLPGTSFFYHLLALTGSLAFVSVLHGVALLQCQRLSAGQGPSPNNGQGENKQNRSNLAANYPLKPMKTTTLVGSMFRVRA
jgi:hypothetical protein